MSNQVEVSVIIPNYNYGKHIKDCIESVIDSDFDYSKLELVIVDDASTDNSVSIIENIKKKTNIKFNLITQKVNSGLAKTRNLGVKCSSGNYLFFLDSDNFIRKDCLTKHYDFLSNNIEYSACYAPIQRFDDSNKKMLNIFSNESYDYNTLTLGNYIDAMAMIKKSDLIEIGLYDEHMPCSGWEDYELWLRMGNDNKKIHFINGEPLTYYRVHESSMINSITPSDQSKLATYIKTKFNLDEFNNNSLEKINNINPIHYTSVKIFWSGSDGIFCEEKSVCQQTALSWGEKKINLRIPAGETNIEYVRFDIGEQVGILNIHNITIQNNNKNCIWEWDPNEIFSKENVLLIKNKEYWNEKTVQLSTNNDPQFVFRISSLTNDIINSEHTIEIALSTLDNNQFNLLNNIITKPLSFVSEKEIIELKYNVDLLFSENEKIKNEHVIIEVEKESYIKLNQSLTNHIETQNTVINQLNKEKDDITIEAKQNINKIISEKQQNDGKVTDLENISATLNKTIQELNTTLTFQIEKNNELLVEKEKWELKNIELENSIKDVNIRISELNNSFSLLNEKNSQHLLDKEKKISELENQLNEARKSSQELQNTISLQIEKNNHLLSVNEKTISYLNTVEETLKETLKQNNDLSISIGNQLNYIEKINNERRVSDNKKEELLIQLSNIEIKNTQLKTELLKSNEEKETFQKNLNSLNKEFNDYINQNWLSYINSRLLKKSKKVNN